MKKNKLILFDWGGIVESDLTDYTLGRAFDDLFISLGSNEKNITKKLKKYELTKLGSIKELEECYKKIKEEFNINKSFYYFIEKYDYYFNKISYYKDVRDYEISLKDKCFIGIFSNLLIIDKKRIDKQVGLNNYDYVFLSYEYKMKKPDINLYKEINKNLPFKEKDILFIDNRKDNVEAAKKIGWNSVMLNGLELDKIKEVCKKFLNE